MKRTAARIFLLVAFSFAVLVIAGQQRTVDRLANIVGVGAYVPPNETNTALEYVAQRKAALDERERALAERESLQLVSTRQLMDILAVSVGAIAALLALNFYLDWHRRRRDD